MKAFGVSALVFLALLQMAPARAGVPDVALAAYRAGSFEKAATSSLQEGSASSCAFAAQAVIADAISRPEGFCIPCLLKAEQLADRAIQLDPHLIDGYLQGAVAIGFRGRVIGLSAARAEGLAEKARQDIDHALAIDPANVWARASLGAWHLEIVHHAGSILAALTYGASREDGLTSYRTALKDAPDVAVLHFHYALSLLALDADEFRSEAERELHHTLTITTDDALTRYTQAQATRLLAVMQRPDTDAMLPMVNVMQGYPPAGPG